LSSAARQSRWGRAIFFVSPGFHDERPERIFRTYGVSRDQDAPSRCPETLNDSAAYTGAETKKEKDMNATEDLIQEHHAVLVALRILEKVAAATGAKEDQASAHLEQILDFFRGFMDRCHHGKEEDVLFPELERRGVKRDGGPIGVMLAEHEIGRGHVRAMTARLQELRGGDAGAAAGIVQHASAYHGMLEARIDKENNVLFPMADRLVDKAVAEQLAEQFEVIERDRVGEGKHEAYHAMLHALKDHYRID
jgi:hemerythrin-like domain-containing protein